MGRLVLSAGGGAGLAVAGGARHCPPATIQSLQGDPNLVALGSITDDKA